MIDAADKTSAEAVRVSIVAAIGRDAALLKASDKERHLIGATVLSFFAGQLFLHFVGVALEKIGDKLVGAAAGKVVDAAWAKAAGTLKSYFGDGGATSNDEQVEQIAKVSSGLAELGHAIEGQYVDTFLEAGREAVEARLVADNLPEAKAKRIATAVAAQVRGAFDHS